MVVRDTQATKNCAMLNSPALAPFFGKSKCCVAVSTCVGCVGICKSRRSWLLTAGTSALTVAVTASSVAAVPGSMTRFANSGAEGVSASTVDVALPTSAVSATVSKSAPVTTGGGLGGPTVSKSAPVTTGGGLGGPTFFKSAPVTTGGGLGGPTLTPATLDVFGTLSGSPSTADNICAAVLFIGL